MSDELVVQVVNYRTASYLPACLDSALAAIDASGVPARATVLDNASGDDLSGLETAYAGRVAFARAERNLGFGAGHNRLAAAHDAPLLCLLNPDVVCDRPDVLARLLGVLRDPAVAVAGPRLRTPGGATQRWDHGELRGLRARVANGAGHAHWRERDRRADAAWVSGAFLLVRRDAFDRVGGFDEGFFLYKEEEDLCLRIRRGGGRVVYEPAASARHVGAVVAGRDPAVLAASVARYRAKHAAGARGRALELLHRHVTRRLPPRP